MHTNTISKFHTSFEIAGGVPVNTKSPVAKRRFMTTHVFLCILDRRVVRHSDEPSVVTYHSDLNWLVCQIPMCLISIEVVTKLVTDVFDFWLYAIKDSNLLAPHQMLSLTTKNGQWHMYRLFVRMDTPSTCLTARKGTIGFRYELSSFLTMVNIC